MIDFENKYQNFGMPSKNMAACAKIIKLSIDIPKIGKKKNNVVTEN